MSNNEEKEESNTDGPSAENEGEEKDSDGEGKSAGDESADEESDDIGTSPSGKDSQETGEDNSNPFGDGAGRGKPSEIGGSVNIDPSSFTDILKLVIPLTMETCQLPTL